MTIFRMLLFFSIFFEPLFAQTKLGSITGRISDLQTNEALIGANVVLSKAQGENIYPYGATSDVLGQFNIRNVSPGVYTLSVTYIAYQAFKTDPFKVSADSTNILDIRLDPYIGWTAEDAKKDLANNVVRIYENTWFLIMGQYELGKKYGFEIVQNGCNPMLRNDRYNAVVYSYLDRLNGPGWLDKYNRQLDSLKVLQEIYLKTHK